MYNKANNTAPLAPDDEGEIIRKAASGDSEAFAELVRRYESMVYNTVYHMTREREESFDISQEVFIKAFRSLKSFRNECKFSTWLYKICRNAARDYIRSRSRRPSIPLTEPCDDADESARELDIPDEVAARPDERAIAEERAAYVRMAIASLSEDHREIVILRDIEGYSYEDIAEKLGLELGTVKSRLNRARMGIKDFLIKRNII